MPDERKTSLENIIPILDDNDFILEPRDEDILEEDLKPKKKAKAKQSRKKEKEEEEEEDDFILDEDDLDDTYDEDEDDIPDAFKREEDEFIDSPRKDVVDEAELLKPTVKALLDKGILFSDDIKSWDELDEHLTKLPEYVMDSVISKAPTISQKLLNFAFSAGANLTERELVDFFAEYSQEIKYEPIELKTVDQARSFLTEQYVKQGINKVAIDPMLDALEDELDDAQALMQEARSIQAKIEAQPKKTDKMLSQKKQQSYQEKAAQKKFLKDVSTELEATGWKPMRMDKINRALSDGSVREVLSLAGQSPKGLIQLANFTTYFDKETGEFDFEAFIKQASSKDVKRIKKTIAEEVFSSVSKSTKSKSRNRHRGGRSSQLVPID